MFQLGIYRVGKKLLRERTDITVDDSQDKIWERSTVAGILVGIVAFVAFEFLCFGVWHPHQVAQAEKGWHARTAVVTQVRAVDPGGFGVNVVTIAYRNWYGQSRTATDQSAPIDAQVGSTLPVYVSRSAMVVGSDNPGSFAGDVPLLAGGTLYPGIFVGGVVGLVVFVVMLIAMGLVDAIRHPRPSHQAVTTT